MASYLSMANTQDLKGSHCLSGATELDLEEARRALIQHGYDDHVIGVFKITSSDIKSLTESQWRKFMGPLHFLALPIKPFIAQGIRADLKKVLYVLGSKRLYCFAAENEIGSVDLGDIMSVRITKGEYHETEKPGCAWGVVLRLPKEYSLATRSKSMNEMFLHVANPDAVAKLIRAARKERVSTEFTSDIHSVKHLIAGMRKYVAME